MRHIIQQRAGPHAHGQFRDRGLLKMAHTSYTTKKMALPGTSRHRVAPKPRVRPRAPSSRTTALAHCPALMYAWGCACMDGLLTLAEGICSAHLGIAYDNARHHTDCCGEFKSAAVLRA